MRLRRSPSVLKKRCYSKRNDFRVRHFSDMPTPIIDVRYLEVKQTRCGPGTEITGPTQQQCQQLLARHSFWDERQTDIPTFGCHSLSKHPTLMRHLLIEYSRSSIID